MGCSQAQFGAHLGHEAVHERGLVRLERGKCSIAVTNQRHQRLGKCVQIPKRHIRLACKRVAALLVGVVADVAGVECVEETKRAVVDGQAQDAHVVGVHHAVAKAHGLPPGEHVCGSQRHGVQQRGVRIGRALAIGVVMRDDKVGKLLQMRRVVGLRKVLEVSKTYEAGRGARDHAGGFQLLTPHGQSRSRDAQRARGRYAQGVHGFRTQKFTD